MAEKHLRIFSFGGGIQSTSVFALQMMGELEEPFDAFVYANVGNDSENPATVDYVENVIKPRAAQHGIRFEETCKTTFKKPETLIEYIYRTKRSVPIPARMSNGAPGNRSCTNDFKIRVIDKWVKAQGVTHATIGLGISIDEFTRMRDEQWHDTYGKTKIGYMKRRYHPLIHMQINRLQCRSIIERAGLPMPEKSSCWFCPFKRRNEWIEMKRTQPALFQRAIELEEVINEKRNAMGRDYVYLHPDCVPIKQAVGLQYPLPIDWGDEVCGGYCHT